MLLLARCNFEIINRISVSTSGCEVKIMGDTLSQEEIDKLLNALSSGELDADQLNGTPEKSVKDYNFARPSKFSTPLKDFGDYI